VEISGTKSSWRQVSGSVLQTSILVLILFNSFSNDLDKVTKYTLSKFSNDTKPEDVADASYGCAAVKRDVDSLEK